MQKQKYCKTLFTRPLKKKTKTAVRDALSDIFKISKRQPHAIFADRGREFINSEVSSLLKRQKIKLYHSFSHLKAFRSGASYTNTRSQTLSFHVLALEPITKNINHSYNRSIKMAPAQACSLSRYPCYSAHKAGNPLNILSLIHKLSTLNSIEIKYLDEIRKKIDKSRFAPN
jgi:hypothetical protein